MQNSLFIFIIAGITAALVTSGCQPTTGERSAEPTAGSVEPAVEPTVDKRNLTLLAYLDKTTYKIGEDEEVVGTVVLRNDGDQAVLVNTWLFCNAYTGDDYLSQHTTAFRVFDPSGEELRFLAFLNIRSLTPVFRVLEPGSSIEGYCKLSWVYGLGQEGTYSAQAFYHNQSDLEFEGLSAWKGKLASEVVEFKMIAPE